MSQKTQAWHDPLIGFLVSYSVDPLGQHWPLRAGRNTIGRASACTVTLDSDQVSSKHAVIVARRRAGHLRLWVEDTQSSNGTWLNGEPVLGDRPVVDHADQLRIGPFDLELVLVTRVPHEAT